MSTAFQKRVYSAQKKVPRGSVTTYGMIAQYLNTNAVRAVGTAVSKNPDSLNTPCHRVVLSKGNDGDYPAEFTSHRKIKLLQEEGTEIDNVLIIDLKRYLYTFKQ